MRVRVTFKPLELYLSLDHHRRAPSQAILQALVNESGLLDDENTPEIDHVEVLSEE